MVENDSLKSDLDLDIGVIVKGVHTDVVHLVLMKRIIYTKVLRYQTLPITDCQSSYLTVTQWTIFIQN